ncbi:MAG: trypsin-like peptidase domain-containing protein [Thermoanaerobaculia bacterium]|nr:trypsin-like peptidase domain-containing protein [Thermoanaerobaculia bacterium]
MPGIVLAALFLFAVSLGAQERVASRFFPTAYGAQTSGPVPRLAARADVPTALLEAADSSLFAELDSEAEANGFVRPLPKELDVDARSPVVKVVVRNAFRIRVHLENVPGSASLWIYGAGETPQPVAVTSTSVWTPSIAGETAYIVLDGASTTPIRIREIAELAGPVVKADDAPTCLIDANCVGTSALEGIATLRGAIGHLQFITARGPRACSGGLINDRQGSGTPYLLTANHCFSTQAEVDSLEVFWDYRSAYCAGPAPEVRSMQRSIGGELVATSSESDFTLVRLKTVPAGRWHLGWDAQPDAVRSGAVLHRLSHPHPTRSGPMPQSYSTSTLTGKSGLSCSGRSRSDFIYSDEGTGGLYGGSSGAPVIINDGGEVYVVGQLFGHCGPEPGSGCSGKNQVVDGSFASTYRAIRQFIDGTEVRLMSDRFAIGVTYDAGSGVRPMTAIRYAPGTALFWFTDPGNIEIIVKMIDACATPSANFWVYAGGTTDVGYTISVRDTKTDESKSYANPRGRPAQTITDSAAFACQ